MLTITKTASQWLLVAAAAALPTLGGCKNNNGASGASAPAAHSEDSGGGNGGTTAAPTADTPTTPAPTTPAVSSSAAAVDIKLFRFNPKELTVAPGTTVTWTNEDDIGHTITSGVPDKPAGPINGKLEGKGKTFSYKFDTAGEFPYFCDYHNSMTGTIIVKQR